MYFIPHDYRLLSRLPFCVPLDDHEREETLMTEAIQVIRVALVEDDPAQREGLWRIIRSGPDLEGVLVCASAEEALARLPAVIPDIVLMDIALPGCSGIEAVRVLKPQMLATQFLMLTVFDDPERIFPALAAGASGYLLKVTPPTKLIAAIQDAYAGGVPMTGSIARQVIATFQRPADRSSVEQPLSSREREVLELLGRGLLYKEIAERIGIGLGTVRTHVTRIYEKLHVHNRMEAVARADGRRGKL